MAKLLWSEPEFSRRLGRFRPQVSRTLARAAHRISLHPGSSFSQATGNSLRKSCAHWLAHKDMSLDHLLHGHYQATQQRLGQGEDRDLIFAQDTVYFSYSGHHHTEGLRPIQGKLLGILQHNTLAIGGQSGIPLGLVYLHNWTRGGHQAWSDKESQKWFGSLERLNEWSEHVGDKRLILVQDREGDILDLFKAPRAAKVHLITRVCQPRRYELLTASERTIHTEQVAYLQQRVQGLPLLGQTHVTIDRHGKAVHLTLELSAAPVSIYPDKKLSSRLHKTPPLSLVVAREVAAVNEQGQSVFVPAQAAEWWLVTSLPVTDLASAVQVVQYYALRWRVERLHYTMKSGALQVERLQFDDVATLCHALALYTISAWRLLHLTYLARTQPDAEPHTAFEAKELTILRRATQQPLNTLHEAVQAVGRLVNFAPTKRQPLPGVKVLAKGLEKLNIMRQAWDLFSASG